MQADDPIGDESRGALEGLGDAFERLLWPKTAAKPRIARAVSPTGLYDAEGHAVNVKGHRVAPDGHELPF